MMRLRTDSPIGHLLGSPSLAGSATVADVLTLALQNGLLLELARESPQARAALAETIYHELESAVHEGTACTEAVEYVMEHYRPPWPWGPIWRRVLLWLCPERLMTLVWRILFARLS